MQEFHYLWLIPFFPLLGSIIIRFFGKRLIPRQGVHILACATVILSFLVTLYGFLTLRGLPDPSVGLINGLFPWITVGTGVETFEVWIRFLMDPLSATMTLFVTGIGSLIHIYSAGYMSHEEDYERYFAYLNLFMAMMLVLVLADSVLLMFVGWEGVGLCSYLLIGFWFTDHANANAGKKAFIVNRIGDFGFIIGMMILFWTLYLSRGIWSLDYAVLREHADVFATGVTVFGVSAIVLATLMLFVGATGKSAQIPLYVWLPDAMAGPTPVSALIHAATMVTAGVYMVARLSFLFDLAPFTLNVIVAVGALTAFFSATIGLAQNDIKKVLAYSTVSQLGYMFMACGVGAYIAGINHVVTHAFFKALLFLGAGSVIHAMHHEQDMRKMGGLKDKIPITHRTFLIATIAIAGFPPFAGFFSKDEILWQAFSGHHYIAWAIGLAAAFMTSFYMFRLYYMTFHGECRADEETKKHIHESPKTMTIPLMVLAFFAVIGGVFYLPAWITHHPILPEWMKGVVVYHAHEGDHKLLEIGLAALSVGVATLGWFLARGFYLKGTWSPARFAMNWKRAHTLIYNKYFVDELYDRTVVRGTMLLAALSSWFDRNIIDGAVHLVAWVARMATFIQGTIDRVVVDGLVNLTGGVTMSLGRKVRSLQSGQIQLYVGTIAGVLVVLSFLWMNFLG